MQQDGIVTGQVGLALVQLGDSVYPRLVILSAAECPRIAISIVPSVLGHA